MLHGSVHVTHVEDNNSMQKRKLQIEAIMKNKMDRRNLNDYLKSMNEFKKTDHLSPLLTGCPAQANAIPPHVAETMTTTRSDINLRNNHRNQEPRSATTKERSIDQTFKNPNHLPPISHLHARIKKPTIRTGNERVKELRSIWTSAILLALGELLLERAVDHVGEAALLSRLLLERLRRVGRLRVPGPGQVGEPEEDSDEQEREKERSHAAARPRVQRAAAAEHAHRAQRWRIGFHRDPRKLPRNVSGSEVEDRAGRSDNHSVFFSCNKRRGIRLVYCDLGEKLPNAEHYEVGAHWTTGIRSHLGSDGCVFPMDCDGRSWTA
ncbi:hypothetical protein B296_00029156 [Ensete ventricosum]|uniref:Uncharacterized protein n=1 Tax=Ensete ventricosum TaxID=4639 RepID=A0A426ZSG8_ENSVE|nr:hypothetical protein B296_00029156 [Ensete ventricosum]